MTSAFLDAIASPNTYPPLSVSESVIDSFRFGDSCRIFELVLPNPQSDSAFNNIITCVSQFSFILLLMTQILEPMQCNPMGIALQWWVVQAEQERGIIIGLVFPAPETLLPSGATLAHLSPGVLPLRQSNSSTFPT